MREFEYIARDRKGKEVSGTLNARTKVQALKTLSLKGLIPVSLTARSAFVRWLNRLYISFIMLLPFNVNQLRMFSFEVASLLRGGMPIEKAVEKIQETTHSRRVRYILKIVASRLNSGFDLATAFSGFPRFFPEQFITYLEQAEYRQDMATLFSEIEEFSGVRPNLFKKIIIPRLPQIISFFTVTGILFWIGSTEFPEIVTQIRQMRGETPLYTQTYIAVATYFIETWYYAAISVVAAIIVFRSAITVKKIRTLWHKMLLKTPIVGRVLIANDAALFAHSMLMSIRSGANFQDAVKIAMPNVYNLALREQVYDVYLSLKLGDDVKAAFEKTIIFSPNQKDMLSVLLQSDTMQKALSYIVEETKEAVESTIILTRESLRVAAYVFIIIDIVIFFTAFGLLMDAYYEA